MNFLFTVSNNTSVIILCCLILLPMSIHFPFLPESHRNSSPTVNISLDYVFSFIQFLFTVHSLTGNCIFNLKIGNNILVLVA